MTVEAVRGSEPQFKEIAWVSNQVREELKRFNKECFYEKNNGEISYNMDTVKQYLGVLKEKKTWKELVSKNSSAMVMAVQIALYSKDYSFGDIDGILGSRTKEAIKKFQADNGLPVDSLGRSLPSTIDKLLEAISKEEFVEIPEGEKEEAEVIMEEKEKKKEDIPTTGAPAEEPKGKQLTPLNADSPTVINIENPREVAPSNGEQVVAPRMDKMGYAVKEADSDEKKEGDILDETDVRPEIKEIAENYHRMSDKLKEITKITKAEAIKLSEVHSYHLDLSGLTEIKPETFEALLKFRGGIKVGIKDITPELAKKMEGHGHSLDFNNVNSLKSQEVLNSLALTKGTLRFGSLLKEEDLGPIMDTLVPEDTNAPQKEKGDLYFDGVDSLTDLHVAEKIAQYPNDVLLDGVKTVSGDVARALAKKESGRVFLRGLDASKMDNDILDGLDSIPRNHLYVENDIIYKMYHHRIEKERAGKDLSQGVLDVLDRNVPKNELEKLTHITFDDADALVSARLGYLYLGGVTEIDPKTFGKLLDTNGGIEIGIEQLTPELAKEVIGKECSINFKKLSSITPEAAGYLAQTSGSIKLDAMETLSPEIMEAFGSKKGRGELSFNGVKNLNVRTAEKIAEYPNGISMDGVRNISGDAIKALAKKTNGKISLKGLDANNMDNDILDGLNAIPRQYLQLDYKVISKMDNHRIEQERAGKDLTQTVLDVLDRKVPRDELKNLDHITPDDADALIKSGIGYLYLGGVTEMDSQTFGKLVEINGGLELGISELDPELAKEIVGKTCSVSFERLSTITPEVAGYLAQTSGSIKLDAISKLTPEIMEAFGNKKGWGELSFNGVEELNVQTAERIAQSSLNIYLKGVKTISKEVADALCEKKQGLIYMDGLKYPLEDDVVESLSKVQNGRIRFNADVNGQIGEYKNLEKSSN